MLHELYQEKIAKDEKKTPIHLGFFHSQLAMFFLLKVRHVKGLSAQVNIVVVEEELWSYGWRIKA
jgi:hypothetical protein